MSGHQRRDLFLLRICFPDVSSAVPDKGPAAVSSTDRASFNELTEAADDLLSDGLVDILRHTLFFLLILNFF